jgi:hypothetical protein
LLRVVVSVLAAVVWFAGATPLSATAAKGPVPEVLTATESSAEDIVDYALSGDRDAARATARTLSAAATGPAAGALIRSGVPPKQVAQLALRSHRVAQAARGGSFVEIALAANSVSQLMAGFYAHFSDRVPPTILTLDYLDREAQLRSLAGEPAKVASAVRALRPAWKRVRAKVVAAGGADEAAAFGRHVAAMNRLDHGSRVELRAEAVRGLELVDELEHVFTTS